MDFFNIDFSSLVRDLSIMLLPFLFAITVHEASHAYAANALGDDTAKRLGRLTLNPIAHIDPIGLLFLLITRLFGWAKPVPVDYYIISRKKYGPLIVAAAGPASNFTLAIISSIIMLVLTTITMRYSLPLKIMEPLILMTVFSIQINIALAIFNLLPILPLDGGRILHNLLPINLAFQYQKTENFGMIIILVLMLTNVLSPIIRPIIRFFSQLLISIGSGGLV